MNATRSLNGFLPTRMHRLLGAVEIPWDQLIQAGTTITTTAISKSGSHKKKRKKEKEEVKPEVETKNPVVIQQSTAVPWGPILLVGGVVAAGIIVSIRHPVAPTVSTASTLKSVEKKSNPRKRKQA